MPAGTHPYVTPHRCIPLFCTVTLHGHFGRYFILLLCYVTLSCSSTPLLHPITLHRYSIPLLHAITPYRCSIPSLLSFTLNPVSSRLQPFPTQCDPPHPTPAFPTLCSSNPGHSLLIRLRHRQVRLPPGARLRIQCAGQSDREMAHALGQDMGPHVLPARSPPGRRRWERPGAVGWELPELRRPQLPPRDLHVPVPASWGHLHLDLRCGVLWGPHCHVHEQRVLELRRDSMQSGRLRGPSLALHPLPVHGRQPEVFVRRFWPSPAQGPNNVGGTFGPQGE